MFADIRGYTTYTQQRGDEAAAALATRFAAIASETLQPWTDRTLQFRGDEVLAVFTSARDAIHAAIALQTACVAATVADPSAPLPVGVGLDAGEAVEVFDGYRGGALNLGARLCSIAGPGEIMASQEVVHLARLVDGVTQCDRGSVRLKGLAEPVRVIRLTKDGWDPEHDEAFLQAIGGAARSGANARFAVCPYRGLGAFQLEDADRFFGRDELVAEVVEHLDRARVLVVVGPSGSGKSSLVRAGLIHAVRSGALSGSERWGVALFTPRSNPTEELAYQLRRLAEDVAATPMEAVAPRGLADAIGATTGGLLVVVDQLEELFTMNQRREQEAFLEALSAIADPAGSPVRLVLTVRADFYGVCATFPWLARRATANQVLVGPMSHAQMRRAIEQPAIAAGLHLEDGLADAVLEDAGSEAAALPLVSHAMAETWRRREGDTLTVAGYRATGGVAGAIAQTADELFETAFTEEEKAACRRLLLQLVTPGEGTSDARRRLPVRDLDRDDDPVVSHRVVAAMTDARLLTVDRDTLDIAHEALLHSWPRLRSWIDGSRDDLRSRQSIDRAAAEWRAQDRDPDLLYRGTRVQAALEWAREHGGLLGADGVEFLEASREALEAETALARAAAGRTRRARRVAVAALGVLAVAAAVASAIAFSALGDARERYADSLATQARLLSASDPRTAIALALEASARSGSDPIDARAALVDASQTLAAPFVPMGPSVAVGDASTVVVSPDGSVVATGNRDGTVSTWSGMGEPLARDVAGHALAIEELDVSPDGRWMISGSDDGMVLLWDLADPRRPEPTTMGDTEAIVWSVAFAPDGATAASASEDGTIRLWNIEDREQPGSVLAQLDLDALTVAFSPDGNVVMAADGQGEVTGFSVDDGSVAVPSFMAHGSDVWEIEFNSDGTQLATASSDGRVRIWDAGTQALVAEPFERSAWDLRGVLLLGTDVVAGDEQGRLLEAPSDGSAVRPTAFAAPHGQVVDAASGSGTLATLGRDQRMQLWSRGGEAPAVLVDTLEDGAFALAASPDGAHLAIGDGAGRVRVVSATTGDTELGPLPLHDGTVWALAFSEDGNRLASGGEDGVVQVVDAATGQALAAPGSTSGPVATAIWADDLLITGGADRVARVWKEGNRLGELHLPTGDATSMALAQDGALAVADEGGSVTFWNVVDLTQDGPPLVADDNSIRGLAWSSDGRTLAAASADEVVQLWDVKTRMLTGRLTPQEREAYGVAFLTDGATVATVSGDGAVRLWDVAQAVPVGGPLDGGRGVPWRIVALSDMRFATSSDSGLVRIWDVLNEKRACQRAAGDAGLGALGAYLGEGQDPIACRPSS